VAVTPFLTMILRGTKQDLGGVGYESLEENVDVIGDGGPFVEIDK
jgi:hypothetical protein